MLHKESTPTNIQFTTFVPPPLPTHIRDVKISYDIEHYSPFSSINNKKVLINNNTMNNPSNHTTSTSFITNQNIIFSPSRTSDNFVKMFKTNNLILISKIENNFKQDDEDHLRINNAAMLQTFDQCFVLFQTVMLQTVTQIV